MLAFFEKAYKHRCFVSKSINELVSVARKEDDFYATENYRRFVDEQVEEKGYCKWYRGSPTEACRQ